MSLDVSIVKVQSTEVYSANITHNLGKMAREAGLYLPLWRPEEIGLKKAAELIPFLKAGLKHLKEHRVEYEEFNSENGWGMHEHFVPFVENYLKACEENPDGDVEVSR